ncbi:M64 family metallopeptidase [Myroides sp. LJL119]
MKKILSSLALLAGFIVQGQNFSDHFENKTLRLDYIFAGDALKQEVYLDEISSLPTWAGRKHNLSQNALQGNGQVRVYDAKSKELIYTNSFSTLFQEWLSVDEAKQRAKSYENTVLVPFPLHQVEVELVLFDANSQVSSSNKILVDPQDILIHAKGLKDVVEHQYVTKAKDPNKAINVVFVAEGYQKEQMPEFMQKVNESIQALKEHKPFDKYFDRFNFIAVKSESVDPGVSVPREDQWKNTAVESNFDTFYSERYLTTNRIKKLHDLLAGIDYEHIIILANTPVYGGGGIYNGYTLTTTGHKDFKPVVVHEFGHSFAGLADEYSYVDDALSEFISVESEPWEKNITTLVDFDQKWADQLKPGTPVPTDPSLIKTYPMGVYVGPNERKVYKSSFNCRMKTNVDVEFCQVCQNAIENLILFYTE